MNNSHLDNNLAQLRLLDFITRLESQIDPDENAHNRIMEMTDIIAGLTDWFYDNPDSDISAHPDYAQLMGRFCNDCKNTLERRVTGKDDETILYCVTCEKTYS